MSEQTKIAWCDSTINWWEGCAKVSLGCTNCYAEARDRRFTGGKLWGKGAPRRKSKSAVKDALAFNRKPWICDDCGRGYPATMECGKFEMCACCLKDNGKSNLHRRRIFSLSLGDWLDEEVPIEWLAEMLDTIRQCLDVDWILCTKRPENWRDRIDEVCRRLAIIGSAHNDPSDKTYHWLHQWKIGNAPQNIILLTSVEHQAAADLRIPKLLSIPAARRGLSLEPLLGPVDLDEWVKRYYPAKEAGGGNILDWLIIGGESGDKARPCNVEWIRNLVQQGQAAGVPVFVKQLGASRVFTEPKDALNTLLIRDKKGGDIAEFPEDLRIREFYK